MENVQAMTQTLMQAVIEPAMAAVQDMSEAVGPTERNNVAVTTQSVSTRSGGPTFKQPIYSRKVQDKYNDLLYFEMQVKTHS